MPFTILRGDITNIKADAIVNAANESLSEGGGVCGAIFAKAGSFDLKAECDRVGHCDTGDAVLTSACGLKNAKYIIHAVGPVWLGGAHGEEKLLRSCYRNALLKAAEAGCETVAFPLISSGIYGYPREAAFHAAVSEIHNFLQTHELTVSLVLFETVNVVSGENWFSVLSSFLNKSKTRDDAALAGDRQTVKEIQCLEVCDRCLSAPAKVKVESELSCPVRAKSLSKEIYHDKRFSPLADEDLENFLSSNTETFQQTLLRMIDACGMTDPEVYKRANVDRKLFSKIRKNPAYQPQKRTVLALAIGLRLNLSDTQLLLARAGFALSGAKLDRIVEFFIRKNDFDIVKINCALFAFDQKLLPA